ncbi:unnamed protein product [Protopolystoma xenopodis]|uniref:A20-type domain-containing protein n=1 Tax=Protopolystoma xenopodis TaxID=117903 RepID=A0A3S4ZQY4_9PLAT|nr:unnamed protein product [Protopolystoma xenopodis]
MSGPRPYHRFAAPSILCKNSCGFYGNPSWNDYCSICYREIYLKQEQLSQPKSPGLNLPSSSTQAFSKFEEKRKLITGKGANTVKNIFKFSKDASRTKSGTISEESLAARREFIDFVEKLKPTVSTDIQRQVFRLLGNFEAAYGSKIDQYSLWTQSFYTEISHRFSKNPIYASISPEMADKLLCAIERFITTWIYPWAFASHITDDEAVDLKLQDKIRSLHWVTPELLDAPVSPKSAEMVHYDAAMLGTIGKSIGLALDLNHGACCVQLSGKYFGFWVQKMENLANGLLAENPV